MDERGGRNWLDEQLEQNYANLFTLKVTIVKLLNESTHFHRYSSWGRNFSVAKTSPMQNLIVTSPPPLPDWCDLPLKNFAARI